MKITGVFLPFLFLVCFIFIQTVPAHTAEKLNKSQIVILKTRVVKNMIDFNSLISFAEGCLSDIQANLQQARELSVKGSYGKCSPGDRTNMAAEFYQKLEESSEILKQARFNGDNIFFEQGKNSRVFYITLGEGTPAESFVFSAQKIDEAICNFPKSALFDPVSCDSLIGLIDQALIAVGNERAVVGAYQERINSEIELQNIYIDYYTNKEALPITQSISNYYIRNELRLYELCLQGANGIYNDYDRNQILMEYAERIRGLKRQEKLTGIPSDISVLKVPERFNREICESEMLRYVRIFND